MILSGLLPQIETVGPKYIIKSYFYVTIKYFIQRLLNCINIIKGSAIYFGILGKTVTYLLSRKSLNLPQLSDLSYLIYFFPLIQPYSYQLFHCFPILYLILNIHTLKTT